ncbi:protein of unknown function [Rhodovastum atsumiense]|nr:protein of unknown function [Rhodovastum atsumiense]
MQDAVRCAPATQTGAGLALISFNYNYNLSISLYIFNIFINFDWFIWQNTPETPPDGL